MKCLICLFFLASSVFCKDEELVASKKFNMRPDPSAKSTDIVWGNVKCTFTYQAMGGTNEEWEMGIIKPSAQTENQVSCMVNRFDHLTTYLFFQSFSLKIEGATFAMAQPYNSKYQDLKAKEYEELPEQNMVKESKNFQNSIGKVTLWAKIEQKEEL